MCYCNSFDKIAWIYNPLIYLFSSPKKHYAIINKLIRIKRNYVVLDVGGGTGLIASYLYKDVEKITILDPSKKMLSKIKSNKIEKIVGSAQKIPFKNNTFDVVYCVDSFHHFTNGINFKLWNKSTKECVVELLRVLKKGGVLLIIEFDPLTFRGRLIKLLENNIMRWGSKFYSSDELAKLFDKYKINIDTLRLQNHVYAMRITKL